MDSFNKLIKELASNIYILENNLAYGENQIRFVNGELEKFKKQNIGKYIVLSRYDGAYKKLGYISDTNPEAYLHKIPNPLQPLVFIKFTDYNGCYYTMLLSSFRYDNISSKFIMFDDEASADLFLMVNGGMLDV